MKKIIRITTVPVSLKVLLKGQLKYMSSFYEILAVSSSDGDLLMEVEKEEGVRTYSLKMTRDISPFKDLLALFNLIRLFRKEKPEIIHSHTPKAGTLSMIAGKITGVKYRIHTVAGLPLVEATGCKFKILKFVEKVTYSCATHVWPNSRGLKDYINKNIYTSSKIKVLGNGSSNGINTDFFSRSEIPEEKANELYQKLDIKENDFVFIFIGRITGDKGINELIEAFYALIINCTAVKLLLVGNYENEQGTINQKTIEFIKKSSNIIECGYQNDVRPYLYLSNCLIHPSYREGFPNVVMQALAMDIPAIVSNINGCNEIVKNEYNGLIVEPKNDNELERAMTLILSNKSLYQKLKNNARNSIVSRYDNKLMWKLIHDEYRTLIG
ncbi:glycosyltransferase family 4 protein [Saccharicrinis sp. FJH54]|uniref:glycosyltransferase family 4 protein n=1 Tax=Saccharicrinis sp. FJH54 TaxID=3344665 RepID=UPI0035D4A1E4